jgi:xanthine dehydrogenase molybdenum-binding subunit
VAESIGWKEKRKKKPTGKIRRGIGLAVGTHVSNSAPFGVDYDCVMLQLMTDGSLHVSNGAPDMGQGSATTLTQVAADAMGVPFEKTCLTFADTGKTPFDLGSHASRTLYAVGHCILETSKILKKDLAAYAAAKWGVSENDVEVAGWAVRAPGRESPLNEFCCQAHLAGKQFVAVASTIPPNAPPWHAHAAEVEVDMETGMVRVIKFAAAHDCGQPINPMIVEGQIEGGVLMGIGYALREEIVVDADGKPYNDSFHKYMMPVAGDTPEIDTIIVRSSDDSGPFGAKGVGECGMIPAAPAIAAALEDATGIRFEEFPLTPGRVLAGLKKRILE